METKLLVADHQEVMRAGLKALVARSNVAVVAEANHEKELLRLLPKVNPDVLILDVRFAGEDGFETLTRVKKKHPDLPVLMWSTGDNPTYICRAIALGANGYLPRSVGRNDILNAIKAVQGNQKSWTKEQLAKFTGPPEVPPGVHAPITKREREVLRLLAYGLSNREVSLSMSISYETVKEHVQHLLRKMNMSDRTQAAVWAVRNGMD